MKDAAVVNYLGLLKRSTDSGSGTQEGMASVNGEMVNDGCRAGEQDCHEVTSTQALRAMTASFMRVRRVRRIVWLAHGCHW